MEYLPLNLKIISAKDLKNVNFFGKMDVYLVVSIVGDARLKQSTPVDRKGGKNPNWNFSMKFDIDAKAADQGSLQLHFLIRCKKIFGDQDLGEVYVPIKELLDSNSIGNGKLENSVTYQVRKSSGKPKGELKFSYKFGEPYTAPEIKIAEPVMAYSTDVGPSGYRHQVPPYPPSGYPPAPYPPAPYPPAPYPPAAGGYGYPPAAGAYGYPPAAGAYEYPPQHGYAPPPKAAPKKNKFGLGLGAGLLGGALGGLLIGDIVSDAAYDGGFDGGGFDGGGFDGGGFDF